MEYLNNILTFEEYVSSIGGEILEEGKIGTIVKTGLICLALAGGMLGIENNANAQLIGPKKETPSERELNKKIDDVYNTFHNYNSKRDEEIKKMIQDDIESKIKLKRYQDSIDSVNTAEYYANLEKLKDAFRLSIFDEANEVVYSYEYSSGDTLLSDFDKIIDKIIKNSHNNKDKNIFFTFYLDKITEEIEFEEYKKLDSIYIKGKLSKEEKERFIELEKKYLLNIFKSEFKFTVSIFNLFEHKLFDLDKNITQKEFSKIVSKTDTIPDTTSLNRSQINCLIRFFISLKRNEIIGMENPIRLIGYNKKGEKFIFSFKTFEFEPWNTIKFNREDL